MEKLIEKIEESKALNTVHMAMVKGAISRDSEVRSKFSKVDEIVGKNNLIIEIHELGNFTIVEVASKRSFYPDGVESHFVTIIDGIIQSQISYVLDEQILISLALKYDGLNSKFPSYAYRMLDMDGYYSTEYSIFNFDWRCENAEHYTFTISAKSIEDAIKLVKETHSGEMNGLHKTLGVSTLDCKTIVSANKK